MISVMSVHFSLTRVYTIDCSSISKAYHSRMNIYYFGHSVVYLETSTAKIVIDPFIDGNPKCPIGVDDIQPDFVILTHAHGDHWGNTLEYAKRGATILSTAEIRPLA